jgi:hypothetical protein
VRISRLKFPGIIILLLILLVAGCAKIEAPPGGPVDKTAPSIIATIPAGDSVNVSRDRKISVTFSESVDKKTAQEAVFVSPRLSGDIEYRWRGHTMDMILPDSFASNVTYIVNIGSNVSDWRNNKMAESYQFAFSTGSIISKGRISGTVFMGSKPLAGGTVGLYDSAFIPSITRIDSTYPIFLTQSGATGEYVLDYVPQGKYFIFAFEDKNKNHLFNYPAEMYGLPDRMARVGDTTVSPSINFFTIKSDTSSISILSTILMSDHLIKVRFSKPIPGDKISGNLDRIFLVPSDSNNVSRNPAAVIEREIDTTSNYSFYFDSLGDGQYQIRIDTSVLSFQNASPAYLEGGQFAVKMEPDSSRPGIMMVSHDKIAVFPEDSAVLISFSEPINRSVNIDSMLAIMSSDSSRNAFAYDWRDALRLNLFINGLQWGNQYKIEINQRLLQDLSGNNAGDSMKIYSFRTYNQDSLGGVSGLVKFEGDFDTTGLPYLEFNPVGEKRTFLRIIPDKQFNFQLPPGKYILSGFLDRNNNGKHDIGRLAPLSLAETFAVFPDTVRVRSRFEMTGIEFIFK